ncbi:MAG: hypothetical protein M3Y19_10305, partial [Actinomycetota bacterium]|nr:hypothetical protein [Actinomycetota bacterium]
MQQQHRRISELAAEVHVEDHVAERDPLSRHYGHATPQTSGRPAAAGVTSCSIGDHLWRNRGGWTMTTGSGSTSTPAVSEPDAQHNADLA